MTKRIFLAPILVLAMLTQLACPRRQVEENAQFTIDALTEVSGLWPAKSALIEKGLGIAQKLLDAVKSNNGTDAVTFLEQMIPVSKELANDAALISNPSTRATIVLALSGLNIGLHFLARFYKQAPGAVSVASRGRNVILEFDAEPVSTLKTQEELRRESKARRKK